MSKVNIEELTMATHTVFRATKMDGDMGYGVIEMHGRKYPALRTSRINGDFGHGIVRVLGMTYPVYRTNEEDGDIGYGVVNIRLESNGNKNSNGM